MAEQNTNNKTINFAGRNLDRADFIQAVKRAASEYANRLDLIGDERTSFNDSLNAALKGIYGGDYSVSEIGDIVGFDDSKEEYYNKRTGEKKLDGKPVGFLGAKTRRKFNAASETERFLNEIASRMKEADESNKTNNPSKKTWSKDSMGEFISNQIFGEGNPFSEDQLNTWADDIEGAYSGTGPRNADKRKAAIYGYLDKYKQSLENGDYNISDEDKASEISRILNIRGEGSEGPLPQYRMNIEAPWMSHYLFTDPKYMSPGQQAAADQQAQEQIIQEALKNGENPFNPETEADKYKAREEELAREKANAEFNAWLESEKEPITAKSYTLGYAPNVTLTKEQEDQLGNFITNGGINKNFYDQLVLDASGGLDTLNAGVGKKQFTLNDTNTSGGKERGVITKFFDNQEREKLANNTAIFGRELTTIIDPLRKWRTPGFLKYNYHTEQGYRSFLYQQVLEKMKKDGKLEQFNVGDGKYAILPTMDKDGNAVVYNATKGTITRENVRKYKNVSSIFGQELGKRFAELNDISLNSASNNTKPSIPFNKNGAVLYYRNIHKYFEGGKSWTVKVPKQTVEPVKKPEPEPVIPTQTQITGNNIQPNIKSTYDFVGEAPEKPKFRNQINFSDLALSGGELIKYFNALGTNSRIVDKYKKLPVIMETPYLRQYKLWSQKPLFDTANKIQTDAQALGNKIASGTSDQGMAHAAQIEAFKSGQDKAKPYILQAAENNRADTLQALETANANVKAEHDVQLPNEQAIASKKSNDIFADIQKMHDSDTKLQQLLLTMQKGIATGALNKYNTGFTNQINNDSYMQDLRTKMEEAKHNAGIAATDEERAKYIDEYNKLGQDWKYQYNKRMRIYETNNAKPTGVPFTWLAGTNNFASPIMGNLESDEEFYKRTMGDLYTPVSFKRGGRVTEAGEMHRHYSKLFHDAHKLLITESNKKQRAMSDGYAYYRRLMLHTK